jgi:hypothetical protein
VHRRSKFSSNGGGLHGSSHYVVHRNNDEFEALPAPAHAYVAFVTTVDFSFESPHGLKNTFVVCSHEIGTVLLVVAARMTCKELVHAAPPLLSVMRLIRKQTTHFFGDEPTADIEW